jgi:hypothetical protein
MSPGSMVNIGSVVPHRPQNVQPAQTITALTDVKSNTQKSSLDQKTANKTSKVDKTKSLTTQSMRSKPKLEDDGMAEITKQLGEIKPRYSPQRPKPTRP